METLILAGLLALGMTVLLRALFPMHPQPPQIIYVQAEPARSSGFGCLPLLVVGIVLLLVLVGV